MTETIINIRTHKDVVPNGFLYKVDKEITDQIISIISSRLNEKERCFTEISRIVYKNVGEEYSSPFLSWYNVIFCSRGYGIAPDYDYMHRAVQEGKKTAATVYLAPDSVEGRELVSDLPDDCSSIPYGSTMIYVFHKGKLSDYFDLDTIRKLYELHGVFSVNWAKVAEAFDMPLSFYANIEEFDGLFSGNSHPWQTRSVVEGLILGYPIESTIALINRTVKLLKRS